MEDRSPHCPSCPQPGRRGFAKKLLAGAIGAVLTLVPGLAGLTVIFDPLKRKGATGGEDAVRVTTLSALPADGVPRKFTVVKDRRDAWTYYPATPVGAVYLRRTESNEVRAHNVVCPHAGCFVGYTRERNEFLCPCHNSTFALSGEVNDPSSPSPRGLDELEVEIRNESEVWVRFRNFQPGHEEKIPVA